MSAAGSREYDATYKILVLGDSGVGKTSLIHRFVDGVFSESYISTIGIDSKSKITELDGQKVRLQLWDTAGQERFRTLTSAYYRGAMGIILVYDVTNDDTFNNINTWLENIDQNASHGVCRILIGNKCDAADERMISTAVGKQRAGGFKLAFFETSAKEGVYVQDAFMEIARLIKAEREKREKSALQNRNTVLLEREATSRASCCN